MTGFKCCINLYSQPNYAGQRQVLKANKDGYIGLSGYVQVNPVKSYEVDICQVLEGRNVRRDKEQFELLMLDVVAPGSFLVLVIIIGLILICIEKFPQRNLTETVDATKLGKEKNLIDERY